MVTSADKTVCGLQVIDGVKGATVMPASEVCQRCLAVWLSSTKATGTIQYVKRDGTSFDASTAIPKGV